MMSALLNWLDLTSGWELLAVVLALAYLLLAVKRSLWCWPCAFVSSVIYVALMFEARLYMQALLNIFYVAMAVYGFIEWRRRGGAEGQVVIARWRAREHLLALGAVSLLTIINAWLLIEKSDAVSPFLDSFVTWGSVVTTWMVARRVMENWLYWILIDGVAAYVYFEQGLYATAILFLIYIGIVIQGFRVWVRESRASCTLKAET